jgi:hypothetical protein
MLSPTLTRFVRTSFLFALLIAITPALRAQENRAALDAFVKQMREHDAAIEELAAKDRKTPVGGLNVIRTASTRLQTIKTDGLPADLQAAFRDYVERTQAVAAVFKEWPTKAEDVQPFVKRKLAENPNFLVEGKQKNAPAMTALDEAVTKLAAVAKKYGLENFAELLQ